jgi:hypothetical protein
VSGLERRLNLTLHERRGPPGWSTAKKNKSYTKFAFTVRFFDFRGCWKRVGESNLSTFNNHSSMKSARAA